MAGKPTVKPQAALSLADLIAEQNAENTPASSAEKKAGISLKDLIAAQNADEPDGQITLKKSPSTPAQRQSIGPLSAEKQASDKKLELPLHTRLIRNTRRSIIDDHAKGIYWELGKVLDIPGNVAAGVTNFIVDLIPGLNQVSGKLPSGGFKLAFEEMGLTFQEGQEPDNAAFHSGRMVGGALGTLPVAPFGTSVQPARGAVELAKPGIIQTAKLGVKETAALIGRTAVEKPIAFVTGEVIAAEGGGLVGFAAKERFPDSPAAEFIGTALGATATNFLPARLATKAAGFMRDKIKFFRSTKGGEQRAAKRILREIDDVKTARTRLKDPEFINEVADLATPAQRTGDEGLMEIERAIIDSSHLTRHASDAQVSKMNSVIVESMRPKGQEVQVTRNLMRQQNRYLQDLLDTRLQMAARDASEEISKLAPKSTAKEANAIARRIVDDVERAARVDEDLIWAANNKNLKVRAGNAINVMRRELRNLEVTSGKHGRGEQFPAELELRELLGQFVKEKPKQSIDTLLGMAQQPFGLKWVPGKLDGEVRLGALQVLRSRILRRIRAEKASEAPANNTIRILEDLQEALLHDMGAASTGPTTPEGLQLRQAIDYSRLLNERFSRGVVGRLKGVSKTGTQRIPDSQTLEVALGGPSPKAAENVRQIVKAAKTAAQGQPDAPEAPPELMAAMEDFIKDKFQFANVRGDRIVNSDRATRWVEANTELLDEFPGIKADIVKAIEADDILTIRQRQLTSIGKRISDPKISKATLFIENEPTKLFNTIESRFAIDPQGAEKELTNLFNKVRKDSSGEAMQGMQSAIVEWVRARSMTAGTDIRGQEFISGLKMRRMAETPGVQAVVNRFMSSEQKRRLEKLINSAEAIDLARRARASAEGVIGDTPDQLLDALVGIGGAQTGTRIARATGTGGIQIQAIMSKLGRKNLQKLMKDPASKALKDAFLAEDPKLLDALLRVIVTEEDAKFVARQLDAWLASALFEFGSRSLAEIQEDEE